MSSESSPDKPAPVPLLEVAGVWKSYTRDPWRSALYGTADLLRDLVPVRKPQAELRSGEFWALRQIDLVVRPGEVVGVLGANGAGKSTLLALIAGLLKPARGEIRNRARRVGLIDRGAALETALTVGENIQLQLALRASLGDEPLAAAHQVATDAELLHLIDAPVGTLSTGMRLRLILAIQQALNTDLLVIDEALGGGDVRFRTRFRKHLADFVEQGGGMLVASHDLTSLHALCDRCLLLDQGEVRSEGAPQDVIQAYLELLRTRESASAASSSAVASPSARRGGPISGLSVESVELQAEPGSRLRTLAPARVSLMLHSRRSLEAIAVIELGSGDIAPLGSLVRGSASEPIRLEAGLVQLEGRIACLPLHPGHYELRVSVLDASTGLELARLGYAEQAPRFEVAAELEAVLEVARHRQGFVALPVEWL